MKKRAFVLALSLFLFAGVALAGGVTSIPKSTLSGGGNHDESGIYTLNGVVGQSVVGIDTANSTTVCSGFFGCGQAQQSEESSAKVYLPVIIGSGSEPITD